MKRIMIIGQPGSGKSTLARQLGEITGLPVIHIDTIHWQSGWIERSKEEKTRLCLEVHSREQWIFEGGHSATWPDRLERCDTLIWLDFKLIIRSWRVFKRRVQYHGKTRPDLPDNCFEKIDKEFVHWIWSTRNTGKALAGNLYRSAPPDKQLFHLRNRVEVARFIKQQSALRHRDTET